MPQTHDLGPDIERYDREHSDDPEYLEEKLKLAEEQIAILEEQMEEMEDACRQMIHAYEEGSQEEVVWAYDKLCMAVEDEE